MRGFVLVLLVLGCRGQRALLAPADAGALPAEGGAPVPDAPGAPPPGPDVAPDVARLPTVPDAPPADLAIDRPPIVDLGPAPKCEQPPTWNACVERGDGKDYFRRRNDQQCGLCRSDRDAGFGSLAHCLIGDPDDTMVYCARSCFDCCHTRRGAPCAIAADCCDPLVCTSVGALRICDVKLP